MSIRLKLIAILLLISLVPILFLAFIDVYTSREAMRQEIGNKFEKIAVEKARAIKAIFSAKIDETVLLAAHPMVVETVRAANAAWSDRSQEDVLAEILAEDDRWITDAGRTARSVAITRHPLSEFFRGYQNRNTAKYGEIFVTDKFGANLAMTRPLSDYYQADESWWQEAYGEGRGAIFLDDRGMDDSVGAIVIGAVVPIRDSGQVIGILKINFKVTDVVQVVSDPPGSSSSAERVFIMRDSGSVVFDTGADSAPPLTELEAAAARSNSMGWSLANHDHRTFIMGHAPISVPIYSRILPEGAKAGVKGESWHQTTWHVFLEIDQKVAFTTIERATHAFLFVGFLTIILVLSIAVRLAEDLSRPIRLLDAGTRIIAEGNLSHRLAHHLTMNRRDELGSLAEAFDSMVDKLQYSLTEHHKLSRAMEQSHSMVLITDITGRIEYANRRFLEFTGYEADELIGRDPSLLKSDQTPPEVFEGLWQTIISGQTWSGNILNLRKDGQTVWTNLTISPLIDDQNETTHFIATYDDLTERMERERSIRQTQKMESLGSLSGGMAHDINNMLVPIIALSHEVRDNLPPAGEDYKLLGISIAAAERVKDMVEKILAFSRQDSGAMKMVDIHDLIRNSADLVASTMPSSINLTLHLEKGIGHVKADGSQIGSVLLNLVSNALDAMDGQTGRLDIALAPVEVDHMTATRVPNLKIGYYARLTVSDSGPGMPEAVLRQVFDPFFTTKQVGKGSGMGLSMCYGIVSLHGGAIDMSSQPDTGTTVTVYLPLADRQADSTRISND